MKNKVHNQTTDPYMKLIELAIEKGADAESLDKLLNLQESNKEKQAKNSFYEALSGFQSELPEIVKTGKRKYENDDGTYTEYTYPQLSDIGKVVTPLLKKFGLSYRFEQSTKEEFGGAALTLVCILTHKEGHSERSQMTGLPDTDGENNAIQATASIRTYMQRYTLTDALGLTFVEVDDDGNGGGKFSGNKKALVDNKIFYSDRDFNSNFPKWKKAVKKGKKTTDQVIGIINKNGFTLTDDQLDKINGIK